MFEKKFGSTRLRTLEYKLELLKQKLKGSSARLKYQTKLHQRKVINRYSRTTLVKYFAK